ncbi:HEPN domain-containing protein [Selenomonas sp. KH1T6]|uniref:HEPN domain-containing protein n=1 Tax=Selenomonas sp. KH1T6 TaxID=3158784 RepID=UPI0008A796A7|nr:HEPN domain-containing protein [Selenomonas ruminantium]
MLLTKGIIRADLVAARQAIEYFQDKGIRDIKNIAAYHLQQAAEKLIKIQIYKSVSDVNNSQMYTHNLDRLILYAESGGIRIHVPDYIREHSVQISDWEAGSRYDVGFSIRIDTLKKAYDVISRWEKEV